MSRSKEAIELNASIVNYAYGEVAYRLYSILGRRGRLPISALVQHTQLPVSTVRSGLIVLIQQNLAYYFTDERGTTHYEANIDTAYWLMRHGKILDMIALQSGNHDKVAYRCAQIILQLGHPRISDIQAEFEHENSSACTDASTPEANGHNADVFDIGMRDTPINEHPTQSIEDLHEALWTLLETGLIEPFHTNMLRSPTDTAATLSKQTLLLRFGGSTKGGKQKEELNAYVRQALRDARKEGRTPPIRRKKRGHDNGSSNGEKRRKLTNGHVGNGSHGTAPHDRIETLDPDMTIRINYEKCAVLLRTQRLVEVVRHDIGKNTSRIYHALLLRLMMNIPRCRPDPMMDDVDEESLDFGASATSIDLEQYIRDCSLFRNLRFNEGIENSNGDEGSANHIDLYTSQKRHYGDGEAASEAETETNRHDHNFDITGNHDEGHARKAAKVSLDSVAEDKQSRMYGLLRHLQLMAEHSPKFVRKISDDGRGQWIVDFERVVDYVQKVELDTVVYQLFQSAGLRIYQILRQKGKLDEKTLHSTALIKKKDLQAKLANMQRLGFVDVQEVPRDNSRALNRMIFLWFFDKERTTKIMLAHVHKTMHRLIEVLEVERKCEHDNLMLAERSDVQGKEDEVLGAEVRARLLRYKAKERKILGQFARLDEFVAAFRDF